MSPYRHAFALLLVLATAVTASAAEPSAVAPHDAADSSHAHAAVTRDQPTDVETATFSMFCYWTGEATLGRVDGVVASRIGHWSGNEIVQVDYDPNRTNLAQLTQALEARDSLYFVVAEEAATSPQARGQIPKRQLRRLAGSPHFIAPKHSLRTRYPSIWALGLDEQQAIALNSWSYVGGPMPNVLTQEQKARLETNRR